MSQKTSKLISRFASVTGRNYDEMKRWFEGLNGPQRDEAVQHMKETIDRPAAPPPQGAK
jgi:hypothetical protein